MDTAARLDALRKLRRFLDEAFRVPGTSLRFGWDPLIGLIPWAGDVLTAVLGLAIIVQAHHMRLPKVVQLRMLINVAIDAIVGVVPFVGDIADFVWKSNTRNFELLERHADEVQPASPGDWLFVSSVAVAVIGMALVPLFVLYWVAHAVLDRF